jgi:acyl-CoA thioesterase
MESDIQKPLAERIVERMYNGDRFSNWLGIKILEIAAGRSVLQMEVRDDMLNGFDILHGGISYSLADSALAFAANAHGRISVSIESIMSYPNPATTGDVLIAIATEQHLGFKTAIYDIVITNQRNEKVGIFRGTVYRTKREHFPQTQINE